MKTALKEWAVVVEALAEGRQTFLLRKGGIVEGKRGFELKHDRFVFFPTWEHQHADSIRPQFHSLFEEAEPPDPNVLEVRYLAQVTDVLRAPVEMEAIERLARHHIWGKPFIRMRYEYRPDLPLFIVLPRIFDCRGPFPFPTTAVTRAAARGSPSTKTWMSPERSLFFQAMSFSLPEPTYWRASPAGEDSIEKRSSHDCNCRLQERESPCRGVGPAFQCDSSSELWAARQSVIGIVMRRSTSGCGGRRRSRPRRPCR